MTAGEKATKPIHLFYSYSHEDEELRQKLQNHLAALKRNGMIAEKHIGNQRYVTLGQMR